MAPNILDFHVQDVNDVLTAIDHVIDTGLANPSKVTVVGGSHGGFLTTHLIGQVCYFYCCVTDAFYFHLHVLRKTGCYDLS